jgi:hypothetical protein
MALHEDALHIAVLHMPISSMGFTTACTLSSSQHAHEQYTYNADAATQAAALNEPCQGIAYYTSSTNTATN